MELYKTAYNQGMKIARYERDPKVVLLGVSHTVDNSLIQYCFLKNVARPNDTVCLEGVLARDDPQPLLDGLHATVHEKQLTNYIASRIQGVFAWQPFLADAYSIIPQSLQKPHLTFFLIAPPALGAVNARARVLGMEDTSLLHALIDWDKRASPARDASMARMINYALNTSEGRVFAVVGKNHVPAICEQMQTPPAVLLADKTTCDDVATYFGAMYALTVNVRNRLQEKL
ncbi:hypothetical protein COT72_03570 [archaeon CG10_big_fil_rev_8_21_14_0_10_43_11]|nr:MAG: hypothetical protein COT72_03570 [archaeon CG10_big_fil_rev_8_21_14_0_10_43_11]